jgi:type VI secretion system secreted protein Hcp
MATNVDYFLKIKGVDGESTDEKHKGEIELLSFSFGATNHVSIGSASGGAGAGRVAMSEFNFQKKIDKASAVLLQSCCTGAHFDTVTLTCRKAGKEQQQFLTIVLPSDSVSLAFGKIKFEYKEQKPDGSLGGAIIGGWDLIKNVKV